MVVATRHSRPWPLSGALKQRPHDQRVDEASPPRSYIGGELFGNLDRRISGVSAARVDVDDDVVSVRQRASAAPAGGGGVLFGRGDTQCAVSVGDLSDG